MTKWPTGNIPTTSVDSQADKPDRRVFKTLFDKFNQMMNSRGRKDGVARLVGTPPKVPDSEIGRGVANGVAPLNANRKVPAANLPGDTGVPIGVILPYCGGGVSLNLDWDWAHCDGRWLRKTDYPVLWARIGNRFLHGATARTTEFRIPDLRGRMLLGWNGGHAGWTRRNAGSDGGAESATLTAAHMPEHRHLICGGSYHAATTFLNGQNHLSISSTTHGANDAYVLRGRSAEPTHGRSGKAGAASPTPVPTMPPYTVIEWIVRTR